MPQDGIMRFTPLLLAFLPSLVLAWGNLGHQTICQMTMEELTPAASAEVERLIDLDPNFDSFADSCSFADFPRLRRAGHFLNLPRSASAVATNKCPMAVDCLFRAFEDDLTILANTSISDEDRLHSLKLLGHWVGDFHQPLHVSFEDDRGGNDILEQGGPCNKNIHSAWDTCIIKKMIGADFEQNASALWSEITGDERDAWRSDSAVEWANESFQVVLTPSVEYCFRQNGACWYSETNMILDGDEPKRKVTVNHAYMEAHADTIRQRIKQAAVRLAAVLNQALD